MICRRYGCLPSALDGESTRRVLRNVRAGNLLDEIVAYQRNPSRGGSQAMFEAIELEYALQVTDDA